MFRFLKSLFSPRKNKRGLFRFFNGTQTVWLDPLEVINKIDMDPVYRGDKHPQLSTGDGPEAARALEVCVSTYRRALGIAKYDPRTQSGLTQSEVLEVYSGFCMYLNALKKNSIAAQTQPQSTEQMWNEFEKTTTNDTSDSSSINNAKSGEESINADKEPSSL